jgi:hypothetical protein
VDYRQKINDVNFVLSGTDASARDYESVPAVKDLVITADTHVNGETACVLIEISLLRSFYARGLGACPPGRCTCLKSTLEGPKLSRA